MAEDKVHRIFFALWPNDGLREQIKHTITPHLTNTRARKVPQQNWHITLAFLGNVNQQSYDCAIACAKTVMGQAFELLLDRFGFWPRPRVVWLGSSTVPEQLTTLVTNLTDALKACDYQPEHRIYAPHLTLLRKANQGLKVETIDSVHWQVDDFVLVESVTTSNGSVYQVVERWPLNSAY